MKRGQTNICAIFAIDKPKGMTSHDVVNCVRRVTGERRVGHAGTLDPAASGLLIVCVGPATRLADKIAAKSKQYIAQIAFGVSTDTCDLDGCLNDDGYLSGGLGLDLGLGLGLEPSMLDSDVLTKTDVLQPAFAQSVLDKFLGEQSQIPPQFSAKKVDGVRSYAVARKGGHTNLSSSKISVYAANLLSCGVDQFDFLPDNTRLNLPYWNVCFNVSKGTYIRALARDIGLAVGSGACLAALRRISCGNMAIEDALSLSNFEHGVAAAGQNFLLQNCLDPAALLGLPVVEISNTQAQKVSNGAPICVNFESDFENDFENDSEVANASTNRPQTISVVFDGKLQAIYTQKFANTYTASMVIPHGVWGANVDRMRGSQLVNKESIQ